MAYAKDTKVSSDASQMEIKRTLQRFGASKIGFYEDDAQATIMFECAGRLVKYMLPLPDRNDKAFWYTEARNTKRTPENAFKEWEQACKARWRSLALSIKADLVAVEDGIAKFEEKFYAFIVLPGGKTIYEETKSGVEQAYLSGNAPKLLPWVN